MTRQNACLWGNCVSEAITTDSTYPMLPVVDRHVIMIGV